MIDIASLHSVSISGLDAYHNSLSLGRLNYAKPNIELENYKLGITGHSFDWLSDRKGK